MSKYSSDKIESLIMSYDDYDKVERLNHSFYPYTINSKKYGNKILFYMGCDHTHDKKHPQFQEIKIYWNRFIENTNKTKVVFIESDDTNTNAKSEREAIETDGEQGFIVYLAKNSSIPIETPDVSRVNISKYLLKKGYSKDQILYYYFSVSTHAWNESHKDRVPYDRYIKYILEKYYCDLLKWKNYDFSLKNMIDFHKKTFNIEFDNLDKSFFYNNINPTISKNIFNKMARDKNAIRDTKIIKEILGYWDDGYSVFCIFGNGHAVVQRPALEKLLL